MSFVQRLISPKSLRFASTTRQLVAKNTELPLSGWHRYCDLAWLKLRCLYNGSFLHNCFPYYDADVLIIGSNPILNTIYCLNLIKQGRSVIVCQNNQQDQWNYQSLNDPFMQSLMEKQFNLNLSESPVEHWILRFFQLMSDARMKTNHENFVFIDADYNYQLADQSCDNEYIIYCHQSSTNRLYSNNRFYDKLLYWSKKTFFSSANKLELPVHSKMQYGLVFAKEIILTSNLPGFTDSQPQNQENNDIELSYNTKINSVGTAVLIAGNEKTLIKQPFQDILMANN
ncbi:MAG: hypothetical protein HON94_02005 [Methylococcales bacterium]|nr:hypothetical protein [Methylococcales bacterium]MBT7409062.1 hypothetical protein [Methylococcales bacterium]